MMIDHITVAVPDLGAAATQLKNAGFSVSYGGVHSNGRTHMSLCAFGDGSYLELVAPFGCGRAVPLWHDRMLAESGGSAWTIPTEDVGEEIARARQAGIEGRGPIEIRRRRPDGKEGRWELGYLGSNQPGSTLPFLIRDFTERSLRAGPDPRFAAGWAFVVLAVFDMQHTAEVFRSLYGCSARAAGEGVVALEGVPVFLVSPVEFLARFGEAPCGAVLRGAEGPVQVRGRSLFGDRAVAWLDLPWTYFRIGVEELFVVDRRDRMEASG